MLMELIGMIVVGLIVGLVARAILPVPDPMGIAATIVLGIVGALVGGFIWRAIFGDGDGVEWIGSFIGGVLVLLAYRQVTARSARA